MEFVNDLNAMKKWLQSATHGSAGDEKLFLLRLCEKTLEIADVPECDRVFTRIEIYGDDLKKSLQGKSRDNALATISKRAMDFFEEGIAGYQQILAETGRTTILKPVLVQGRGGKNKTVFYLASVPFDASLDVAKSTDRAPKDRIVYERTDSSEINLSRIGKLRYGAGIIRHGSWQWWLFAGRVTANYVFFALSLIGTMLVLSQSPGPLTGGHIGLILGTGLIGAALWLFQFRPLQIMIDRKMMEIDDHHLRLNERPAHIEKVVDPANPEHSIFKIVRYRATCSICGADVELQDGGRAWPDRFVGGCRNSPQEHVYSFDRFTMRGKLLRHDF